MQRKLKKLTGKSSKVQPINTWCPVQTPHKQIQDLRARSSCTKQIWLRRFAKKLILGFSNYKRIILDSRTQPCRIKTEKMSTRIISTIESKRQEEIVPQFPKKFLKIITKSQRKKFSVKRARIFTIFQLRKYICRKPKLTTQSLRSSTN